MAQIINDLKGVQAGTVSALQDKLVFLSHTLSTDRRNPPSLKSDDDSIQTAPALFRYHRSGNIEDPTSRRISFLPAAYVELFNRLRADNPLHQYVESNIR